LPNHANIQEITAQIIHATLYRISQNSLWIFQHIQQTRQLRNLHFTTNFSTISGKIQAIDERPCIHEARMIYFSLLPVKNPKEYR